MKKVTLLILLLITVQQLFGQTGNTPEEAIQISFPGNEWFSGENAFSNAGLVDVDPKSPSNGESKNHRNMFFKYVAKDNDIQIEANAHGRAINALALWSQLENGEFELLAHNAQSYEGSPFISNHDLEIGKEYFVSYETFNSNATFSLNISASADYDTPEGAIRIPHIAQWSTEGIEYSTVNATSFASLSSCGESVNRWFVFSATEDKIRIELTPALVGNFSGNISLWDSSLNPLACTDRGASAEENTVAELVFENLEIGKDYFISVGSTDNRRRQGPFILSISGGENSLWVESNGVIYPVLLESKVGIGVQRIPEGYSLALDGKAILEEVKVQLSENWPDYVFAKDYDLKSLAELADYIKENGHLPNIPSAETVNNDGISLGEMNAKLLEKIEELTLYIFQQEEKMKEQKKQFEYEIQLLNKRLEKLEK